MMRKLPLIFSGLFFALPAVAQESEPSAPPGDVQADAKDETPATAKPEPPKAEGAAAATGKVTLATDGAAPGPTASKATTTSQTTAVSGPAVVAADNSWKFEYHGYIRAPMRVGLGRALLVVRQRLCQGHCVDPGLQLCRRSLEQSNDAARHRRRLRRSDAGHGL